MARVPHLLLSSGWSDARIVLDEGALHHLSRVLRLQDGRAVTYTDGSGLVGDGVYADGAVARGRERSRDHPAPSLTIAVAPPRVTDRARMIVEKLAELGVDRLVWLETARGEGTPPRPDRAAAWARAALEQSKGAWLMEVEAGYRVDGPWPEAASVVVADRSGAPMGSILPSVPGFADQPIVGLIGPEGGFVSDEVPGDVMKLSLGDHVLRVETAAIALAVLVRVGGVEVSEAPPDQAASEQIP